LLEAAETEFAVGGFGRAKRCVLLFLMGGPPQHDTWDLMHDYQGRPIRATRGQPIQGLVG
jgi:hypothetical protein